MTGTPIATSDIVAQAFAHLELAAPAAFGEDSEQVEDAERHYGRALRGCLEFADWSFASVLASLPEATAPDGTAADAALPHLYLLPADCVAIREVQLDSVAWRRDLRYLRADVSGPLPVRYTALIETEAQLPAEFADAVALRLAVMMSSRWLTNVGKRDRLRSDAATVLAQAARHDARNATPRRWDGRPVEPDWADEARI